MMKTRKGMKFITEVPSNSSIAVFGRKLIVASPNTPPKIVDETGKILNANS